MFDRGAAHTVEQGTLSVVVKLSDGQELHGKLTVPRGKILIDVLNGPHHFLEFEPFAGEKTMLAKSNVVTVQPIQVPDASQLAMRAREFDGFDPFTVLGVAPKAGWDEVRRAYIALAKDYHPDRYSTVELPAEVKTYLSAMARRVNAAYAALEPMYALKKEFPSVRQEPVYTSPAMRG
jgi:hypothetical protein